MKRILLTILGSLALALGTFGMILPVLPTTPFLLLTIASIVTTYIWTRRTANET